MNEIELFKFENHDVRVVMIDDEPRWLLTDVAKLLGYRDAEHAKRILRDSQFSTLSRGIASDLGFNGGRLPLVVSEGGLHRLIMRSDRPAVERFQDWVTDEVLPSIRKAGSYGTQKPMSSLDILKHQVALLEAQEKRVGALESKVAAIEGAHDWFTALGYCLNNDLPTERTYCQRLGVKATAVMKRRGEKPVRRQDATFGMVNTYPIDALDEALEEISREGRTCID